MFNKKYFGRQSAIVVKAFTLIELLIVIAISVIIAGALVPLFGVTKQDAKVAKACSELDAIKTAALHFYFDLGYWPDGEKPNDLLDDWQNISDWNGPYLDRWPESDPWGRLYQIDKEYRNVSSFGKDVSDSSDDIIVKIH